MELALGLIALAVVGYAVYFYNTREKKQDAVLPSTNRYTGESVEAPYKVEPPVQPAEAVVAAVTPVTAPVVNNQITDAVTQTEPVKKPRKPRTPKAEKPAKEKAAPKKAAAIKAKPRATKSKKT